MFHRTIKMKLLHVKSGAYIAFVVENSDKDCKFKVSGHVRISKYKNVFAKDYTLKKSLKYYILDMGY